MPYAWHSYFTKMGFSQLICKINCCIFVWDSKKATLILLCSTTMTVYHPLNTVLNANAVFLICLKCTYFLFNMCFLWTLLFLLMYIKTEHDTLESFWKFKLYIVLFGDNKTYSFYNKRIKSLKYISQSFPSLIFSFISM